MKAPSRRDQPILYLDFDEHVWQAWGSLNGVRAFLDVTNEYANRPSTKAH